MRVSKFSNSIVDNHELIVQFSDEELNTILSVLYYCKDDNPIVLDLFNRILDALEMDFEI